MHRYLPYFQVANSVLFLPSTTLLSFSFDVVLTLSILFGQGYIVYLTQNRRNPIAKTLGLRLFCIEPSTWSILIQRECFIFATFILTGEEKIHRYSCMLTQACMYIIHESTILKYVIAGYLQLSGNSCRLINQVCIASQVYIGIKRTQMKIDRYFDI